MTEEEATANNWRHIDTFEWDKDGNPLFTGAVLVLCV
jgi:hypothetical protein